MPHVPQICAILGPYLYVAVVLNVFSHFNLKYISPRKFLGKLCVFLTNQNFPQPNV
jgi:hypothetical protein